MSAPAASDFARYLAAKKPIDDRALNRVVWDQAWSQLKGRDRLRILEVGAGIGTMIERVLEWTDLRQADYLALDSDPRWLVEARTRLVDWARRRGWRIRVPKEGELGLEGEGRSFHIRFLPADISAAMASADIEDRWDLVLAHAVLDLLDLDRILPPLVHSVKPAGHLLLTLNFDGATAFTPRLEGDLDLRVEAAYHATMDERRIEGRPTGGSRSGRAILERLPAAGAEVVAVGDSDWVVLPMQRMYRDGEEYFLGWMLDTVERAVRGRPEVSASALDDWISLRRRQLRQAELGLVAHNLDLAARRT